MVTTNDPIADHFVNAERENPKDFRKDDATLLRGLAARGSRVRPTSATTHHVRAASRPRSSCARASASRVAVQFLMLPRQRAVLGSSGVGPCGVLIDDEVAPMVYGSGTSPHGVSGAPETGRTTSGT